MKKSAGRRSVLLPLSERLLSSLSVIFANYPTICLRIDFSGSGDSGSVDSPEFNYLPGRSPDKNSVVISEDGKSPPPPLANWLAQYGDELVDLAETYLHDMYGSLFDGDGCSGVVKFYPNGAALVTMDQYRQVSDRVTNRGSWNGLRVTPPARPKNK